MEKDLKLLFGKILGELYRIQYKSSPSICNVTEATIYGLLRGFETVIDDEIEKIGFISPQQLEYAENILNEYFENEDKLNNLKGFYDIEQKLKDGNVNRAEAITIFKYLKANEQFTGVIEKMNSQSSPHECKKFEITI